MERFENLFVYTGQSAAGWGAAPAVDEHDLLLQGLCASPVLADHSPSCHSSNQSSASFVHLGSNDASGLTLQQQLEPHPSSFAPFAGYRAGAQQQMVLFNASAIGAAPFVSSFSNLGAANMLPQQPQHQFYVSTAMQYPGDHASSAQQQAAAAAAAAALAEPFSSSNHDAALPYLGSLEQRQIQLLQNAQHLQHMVPQPNDTLRESFLQPHQQQQPSFVSFPLVQSPRLGELQQHQILKQLKAEPNCSTFNPQQQQMAPSQCQQHYRLQTAQQVLAAADAAAAARRPADSGPAAKSVGTKRPAAKELKQPKVSAKAKAPASSEDDAAVPAAPKKRGRPPANPGQYSRGYMAIKAYRERKKGMVSDGLGIDSALTLSCSEAKQQDATAVTCKKILSPSLVVTIAYGCCK
jgi:hypothetical protein